MNIKRGGAGLLLTELLIAVMFFSLASAICLRLFVAAHQSSVHSAELSRAVIEAQNIAETFKAANGDLARTAELLGAKLSEPGSSDSIRLNFNADWERDIDLPAYFDIFYLPAYSAILSPNSHTDTACYATVTVYKNTIDNGPQMLFSIDIAAVRAE